MSPQTTERRPVLRQIMIFFLTNYIQGSFSQLKVSSRQKVRCINKGELVGPSKFQYREGICSPDGNWAFWLYGNQCRMMLCGPNESSLPCGLPISLSSRPDLTKCPAQEGLDRYVDFTSKGDLIIYAYSEKKENYNELWRLSSNSNQFGSVFVEQVEGGIPVLSITNSGCVQIKMNETSVWNNNCEKIDPTPSEFSPSSKAPTELLTKLPSYLPSHVPSKGQVSVTATPAKTPTEIGTNQPTFPPTKLPTKPWTELPTKVSVTAAPAKTPTEILTNQPTFSPSTKPPTKLPTKLPIKLSTAAPAKTPTEVLTNQPTLSPTKLTTKPPTKLPTEATVAPTKNSTKQPTLSPTQAPSKAAVTGIPTEIPTKQPTLSPTPPPTRLPTQPPTGTLTVSPSTLPSKNPSNQPTSLPTTNPSFSPTLLPSQKPTFSGTTGPTSTKIPNRLLSDIIGESTTSQKHFFSGTGQPTSTNISATTPLSYILRKSFNSTKLSDFVN